MGYIYKIVNEINQKIYVGKAVDLDARWYKHRYLAKSGFKRHLYEAMRKYGVENFHIEVIEHRPNDILNDREKYWIGHFNSTDRKIGYNKSFGGEGGDTWSLNDHKKETSELLSKKLKGKKRTEELKQKMHDMFVGREISEEQRAKISATLKDGYKSGRIKIPTPPHYDMTGFKHSDKSREKMSAARKGKTYDDIYGIKANMMRQYARERISGEKNWNYKELPMDDIVGMIQNGLMLKDIAKKFGVSYQTIYGKLKKMGLSVTSIRHEFGLPERIRKPYGKRT